MKRQFDYDVFISYRSSIYPDKPVAEALQHDLETYPVPTGLRKNIAVPTRWRNRLRVFRDLTDLNAAPNLAESLKTKLRRSRFLIAVCTPKLLESDYCATEIEEFRRIHGDDHVLLLLVQGDPGESFPATLNSSSHAKLTSGDSLTEHKPESEPLAADVRASDVNAILKRLHGPWTPRSHQARFKLLAPILGCESPDDLIRRHATRVRRQFTTVVLVSLALAATALFIIRQQQYREQLRREAASILAKIDGQQSYPSAEEFSALRDLADSPSAVRLSFLEQLVNENDQTSEANAIRLKDRFGFVAHAAVGLDRTMRDEVRTLIDKHGQSPLSLPPAITYACAELGSGIYIDSPEFNRLVADNYVANMAATANCRALCDLAQRLAKLGRRLPPEPALAARERLLAVMKDGDFSDLWDYCKAIRSLPGHFSDDQAAFLKARVLAAVESLDSAPGSLAEVFKDVVDCLSNEDAAALAVRLIDVMEKKDTAHFWLASGLPGLADRLTPKEADPLARRLVARLEQTTDSFSEDHLSDALEALSGVLGPECATEIAALAVNELESRADLRRVHLLSKPLRRLVERLPADRAVTFANRLYSAMKSSQAEERLFKFRVALIAFAKHLDQQECDDLANRIVTEMRTDKYTHFETMCSLVRFLAALGNHLREHDATAAATAIVAAMEKTGDFRALEPLAASLDAIDYKISASDASALSLQILSNIESTHESFAITAQAKALATLADRLSEDQALVVARRIMSETEEAKDLQILASLAEALCAMRYRLTDESTHAFAHRVVASIETGDLYSSFSIATHESFGYVLTNLPSEQAASLANRLLAHMEKDRGAPSPYGDISRSNCVTVLRILIPRLSPKDVVALLKSLPCVDEARTQVLAELDTSVNGVIQRDPWNAVDWAKGHGVNVEAVPRFPHK